MPSIRQETLTVRGNESPWTASNGVASDYAYGFASKRLTMALIAVICEPDFSA
jgi:hypothetical protein